MKFLSFIFLLSTPAFAGIEILSTRRDTFAPERSTCAQQGICSLREFGIVEQKKRVRFGSDTLATASHMTDVRIILRTDTVEQISDYGVVQFIKGCQFSTDWDGQNVTHQMSISRDHFGQAITFRHRDWEIDTDSADPLYHSYEGNRFALWRWNTNPQDLTPTTAKFLHFNPTPHPRVFFTDLPGSMAGSARHASNSSLEFKVCIFKLTDLPAATDPRGSNFDHTKAIHCLRWSDSQIFDFRTQRMTHPVGIDARCSE